jgi:hypothetical protein
MKGTNGDSIMFEAIQIDTVGSLRMSGTERNRLFLIAVQCS